MAALEQLIVEAGSAKALAGRLRQTPESHISALRAGRRGIGDDLAAKLERAMGKPVGWIDDPAREARLSSSHSFGSFAPISAPDLPWGEGMLAAGIGPIFWTTLPDQSMAPRAPQGKRVCFDRSAKPTPGDGVLVRDRAGALYFRIYRARSAAHWVASAANPIYQDLDSERDGLEVVAVLIAEEGRWG